ncbi:hypothetical protein AB0A73_22165 [Glycomyces sp. NPDC047369]
MAPVSPPPGYRTILTLVLEAKPAVRRARLVRFLGWAAVAVGVIALAPSWDARTWAAWLIAAGFVIAVAARRYLMAAASGGLAGRTPEYLIAVAVAATLTLALVVAPLSAADTSRSSALWALAIGAMLVAIDQIGYQWWVWRRGHSALGTAVMVQAYRGALQEGWTTDPATGNQLKVVTDKPGRSAPHARMAVLERSSSPAPMCVAYQAGSGLPGYGLALRRYHVLADEPAAAALAPLAEGEREVPPMGVAEVLALLCKVRRCEAAVGRSPVDTASAR